MSLTFVLSDLEVNFGFLGFQSTVIELIKSSNYQLMTLLAWQGLLHKREQFISQLASTWDISAKWHEPSVQKTRAIILFNYVLEIFYFMQSTDI